MTNKKRRLTPKTHKNVPEELANTNKTQYGRHLHNKEAHSQELAGADKKQTAILCAAVMLCSVGVLIYVVFIKPYL
jgi:uncharacterized membrane protein